MLRRWIVVAFTLPVVVTVGAVSTSAQGQAGQPASAQSRATQPPPAASQPARPNVVERPWTTTPGSPYDRAQAVAAERVKANAPLTDFPAVDAPPGDELSAAILAVGLGPEPGVKEAGRPTVAERPWTRKAASPYARAQAAAAERLQGQAAVPTGSPYPAEYLSPVPAPFVYQPSQGGWRGGRLYPGMPFAAIGYPGGPIPRFRARPAR
jgi:hypothetical protein